LFWAIDWWRVAKAGWHLVVPREMRRDGGAVITVGSFGDSTEPSAGWGRLE
jgi:hypothetical protein